MSTALAQYRRARVTPTPTRVLRKDDVGTSCGFVAWFLACVCPSGGSGHLKGRIPMTSKLHASPHTGYAGVHQPPSRPRASTPGPSHLAGDERPASGLPSQNENGPPQVTSHGDM
jgi:hypothetical protein